MKKLLLSICTVSTLLMCPVIASTVSSVTFEKLVNLTPSIPVLPDQIFQDDYGRTLHYHPDDKYLFVGATVARPDPTKTAEGAVSVYAKNGNNWVLTQVISTNGVADHFSGFRIRAFDDWLFIAATGTPIGGNTPILQQDFTGSIQIYKRNNLGIYEFSHALDRTTPGLENLSTINPLFFEPAPPPLWSIELGGIFGTTFDFSEDHKYLLVGAATQGGTDSLGQPLLNAGAVYSFKVNKNTGNCELVQTIHNPEGQTANGTFGGIIKTYKNYALISTAIIGVDAKINGNSYVYLYKLKSNGQWECLQKLESDQVVGLPVNSPSYGGNVLFSDNFGASLAFDDDWALIGAPFARLDSNSIKGAAYFYKLVGNDGYESLEFKQKIVSNDPNALLTAFEVALDGKLALVADPAHTGPLGQTAQGAILVYHREGDSWIKETNLFDPLGGSYQMFSNGLDVHKNLIFGGSGTALTALFYKFLFIPPFLDVPLPLQPDNVVIWKRNE